MNIELVSISETDDHLQFCKLLRQLTHIDPDMITYNDFLDRLRLIKSNPLHKIIVAKLDGVIVGTITVLIEPKFIHNLSSVAHIEDVVVDEKCRSYGIGKLLVLKAIEISRNIGCYKIILDCSEKNEPFYQKIGFIKKDLQMAYYF